jgi:hypothetical protein
VDPRTQQWTHEWRNEHRANDDCRRTLHEPEGRENRRQRHHHDEVDIGRARLADSFCERDAVFSLQQRKPEVPTNQTGLNCGSDIFVHVRKNTPGYRLIGVVRLPALVLANPDELEGEGKGRAVVPHDGLAA